MAATQIYLLSLEFCRSKLLLVRLVSTGLLDFGSTGLLDFGSTPLLAFGSTGLLAWLNFFSQIKKNLKIKKQNQKINRNKPENKLYSKNI